MSGKRTNLVSSDMVLLSYLVLPVTLLWSSITLWGFCRQVSVPSKMFQLRFQSTVLIDQSVCTILAPANRRIGFTSPRWLFLGRLVFFPSRTPASGANWLLFSIQKSTVEAGISLALKPVLIDRQLYIRSDVTLAFRSESVRCTWCLWILICQGTRWTQ